MAEWTERKNKFNEAEAKKQADAEQAAADLAKMKADAEARRAEAEKKAPAEKAGPSGAAKGTKRKAETEAERPPSDR